MRKLLLFAATCCAYGQCTYTTGKIPQGTIAVFRNGSILRQGPDFTYSKQVITPLVFSPGDKFSALFSIQVTITPTGGAAYTTYRNWVESWDCPGPVAPPAPALQSLETCTGSGTNPPDINGKVTTWDCAGMMRATIKLSDGSTLVLTGVSGAASGSQIVWNPVK